MKKSKYILISHSLKPRTGQGIVTSEKGWYADPTKARTDEVIDAQIRLKSRHLTQATFILDLVDQKVVKAFLSAYEQGEIVLDKVF